jgi:hypothetical protein
VLNAGLIARGQQLLTQFNDEQLAMIVRWLEAVAEAAPDTEIEPEELWLLASGHLKQLDEEARSATPLNDWRKYLDEL